MPRKVRVTPGEMVLHVSKSFPVETVDYLYQAMRYVKRNALQAHLGERFVLPVAR